MRRKQQEASAQQEASKVLQIKSVILHVLFTNNAGSSLLQHIAQSYSDIESLQFADLLRDYFSRRKLKRYRFQEEVLRDLREECQI